MAVAVIVIAFILIASAIAICLAIWDRREYKRAVARENRMVEKLIELCDKQRNTEENERSETICTE